ncbi:ABC transporter ATP-binding protein [Janibacter cremeus]|uniref:ABC-2 type transport system ATP-binding protein n=1 Tax=Janibacter cremeus TaxID=1285192 RepID=A0A852VP90_9MICO|nr:ABC transporter ATP-binding protein [Janibacter cremeus]NYF97280.1 ABC-2 type transport system ATP-binding protein [Janibacter cremeus]
MTTTTDTGTTTDTAATDADAVIEVSDLRKQYGARGPEALKGVSFTVAPGEIFGLLGPNGAGKTTTIGVLTTRVRPSSGSASIDGIDVAAQPQQVKRRIAVMPQRANLDRALTARENLTFHGAYFGVGLAARRRRADELLEEFGLADRATERVDNYSGGMAQRLMIARALMHQPVVLFLDEPTTGLDPQSRLFLWDRVAELRASGTTILLTTHDMAEADRLCDRIAIVDHGELIALDTPSGLRGLLPEGRGLDLVVRGRVDPAAAFEPMGVVETVELDDDRWRVRCFGEPNLAEAIAVAESNNCEVLDVHRLEGSLEDVFVHLTGRDLR